MGHNILKIAFSTIIISATNAHSDDRVIPFLENELAQVLQADVSGIRAKHDLNELTRHHRMRGSKGYKAAANYVENELKKAGLDHVETLSFKADGETYYGTQRSRKAWNAESAELWQISEDGSRTLIARYADNPVILAQDSVSGSVESELIDVGSGLDDADYAGKNVKGKLVLTSSQPGATAPLAVTKYGAKGIISYAQNQKTAWSEADDRFIRWGHLDSFGADETFGIMVSLRQARAFQKQMKAGKTVRLSAKVKAERTIGSYDIVYARINGSNPDYDDQAIAFSCHLDHQRPGANDNASGCATILEVARALSLGIANDRINRPLRPIIFFWPPEIEGTITLLNAKPALAASIKAAIHMDMVGGSPETKAIFRVSRGPMSIPSFIYDVADSITASINDQTERFASGEDVPFPIIEQDGGREALGAITGRFSMGSDHQAFSDSSFGIPAIYLHDWPDRFIHTNFDTPANIDTSKLKRAGFIGTASALTLANWEPSSFQDKNGKDQSILESRTSSHKTDNLIGDYIIASTSAIYRRMATMNERATKLNRKEAKNLWRHHWQHENDTIQSSGLPTGNSLEKLIKRLRSVQTKQYRDARMKHGNSFKDTIEVMKEDLAKANTNSNANTNIISDGCQSPGNAPKDMKSKSSIACPNPNAIKAKQIYQRNNKLKGPMFAFGYHYLNDKLGAEKAGKLGLPRQKNMWSAARAYDYEALNFVDGERSVQRIRNALSAEFGPVDIQLVIEYLEALEAIGVIEKISSK
jgi:hypothetical protein